MDVARQINEARCTASCDKIATLQFNEEFTVTVAPIATDGVDALDRPEESISYAS